MSEHQQSHAETQALNVITHALGVLFTASMQRARAEAPATHAQAAQAINSGLGHLRMQVDILHGGETVSAAVLLADAGTHEPLIELATYELQGEPIHRA